MNDIDKELIQELKMEDLNEYQQNVANIIGIEKFVEISFLIGGSAIYFPKRMALLKEPIKRKICSEFNGFNITELTKKYNVSSSLVYDYIKRKI